MISHLEIESKRRKPPSYARWFFMETAVSQDQIELFLEGQHFAIVGASADRGKYGNKVFRAYLQAGLSAYPVNPNADAIEGQKAFRDLRELSQILKGDSIHGVSIITPPQITELIVEQAIELGIQNIWMQPGAENSVAVAAATDAGLNVIAGGPCILVRLRFRDQV